MTLCIGWGDGKRALLALDSYTEWGMSLINKQKRISEFKVGAKKERLLIATAGFALIGTEVSHNWRPPTTVWADTERYMAAVSRSLAMHFTEVPAIWEILKDKEQMALGGAFLVAFRGRIFDIDGSFAVGETACGFECIGEAEEVAQGALHVLLSRGVDPHDAILEAMAVGAEYRNTVRPPYNVLEA